MTWVPLVTSEMFDGIKADVLTASSGILAVVLVILGVGLIIATIRSR